MILLAAPSGAVGLLASAGVFVVFPHHKACWPWAAGAALVLPVGLFCLAAAFTVAQARRSG